MKLNLDSHCTGVSPNGWYASSALYLGLHKECLPVGCGHLGLLDQMPRGAHTMAIRGGGPGRRRKPALESSSQHGSRQRGKSGPKKSSSQHGAPGPGLRPVPRPEDLDFYLRKSSQPRKCSSQHGSLGPGRRPLAPPEDQKRCVLAQPFYPAWIFILRFFGQILCIFYLGFILFWNPLGRSSVYFTQNWFSF